jgi:protein TonB
MDINLASLVYRDSEFLRRERHVLAAFACLSLTIHVLLLGGLPRLLQDGHEEAPRPLDVRLREVEPARRVEPPKPEPVKPEPPKRESRPNPEPIRTAPVPAAAPPLLTTRDSRADVPPVPAVSAVATNPPQETPTPTARVAPPAEKPSPAQPVTQPLFNAAYLRNTPPRYPIAARRSGEQGTVMLKVLVTRDGAAASVNVERSSGSRSLDSAATETVRGWRFVPARQGEQAVEAWVLVPVEFRLDQAS